MLGRQFSLEDLAYVSSEMTPSVFISHLDDMGVAFGDKIAMFSYLIDKHNREEHVNILELYSKFIEYENLLDTLENYIQHVLDKRLLDKEKND